ncbi:MAG: HAD-IA family hydrolase [Deltaproteobacteria bacterium]|nr:HAD-IA family hydrolase [Deltaproteobacteria bacterium]
MTNPVVCFDLGNVLVKLRFDRCVRELCRLGNRDYRAVRGQTPPFFDEHGLALSCGALGADAFLDRLAGQFGVGHLDRGVVAGAWCAIFDPWPEMESVAQAAVTSGAAVWLLSNTDPMHFAYIHAKMPVLDDFSGWHLSYEIGANKPDRVYYERFFATAEVDPGDCVFFDDRPENVEAARSLGMDAVLFAGDVAAARNKLRSIGLAVAL